MLRVTPSWEKKRRRFRYRVEEEGGRRKGKREKGGFGSASARLEIRCSLPLPVTPPPTPHTVQPSLPTAQEFKGSFEPLGAPKPLPSPKGVFLCVLRLVRWGSVCVLGPTCPSSDTRADSDSDWAADQDHTLLSPLLPPPSFPTHDMCHRHRSALEDMTSWRSGQIPKAENREGKKCLYPFFFFSFFTLMDYLKSSFFLNA